MGRPLAASILQSFTSQVPSYLRHKRGIRMAAYSYDWLISHRIPVNDILQDLAQLGYMINCDKSVLTSTERLTYLGLDIDARKQTFQLKDSCLHHLHDVMWLCCASLHSQ
jgi:hypothetical protein